MNIWQKRMISGLLALCLIAAFLPAMAVKAEAKETVKFSEMLARAEAMVNYEWTPKRNIKVWHDNQYNGKDYFLAGQTVKGMPFTLFTDEFGGAYGLVTFEEYKQLEAGSGNYTASGYCGSTENKWRSGPRFGSCCASFVREVFGGSFMKAGKKKYICVPEYEYSPYTKVYKNVKPRDLKPGDALYNDSYSHIVWVAGVSGSKLVIYEQTYPVARRLEIDLNNPNNIKNGYLYHMDKVYKNVARNTELVMDTVTGANPADYYYLPVQWAAENGILNAASGTFSPNKVTTRAEVVEALWKLAGKPNPRSTKNPFTDVKAGADYYSAVLWAVENGITTGTSATKFNPGGECTRGQVVTFLWRTAGKPEPTSSKNPFTDVTQTDYFYKAVLWAVENGITTGTTATKFDPSAKCTNAQTVTFLYRSIRIV